MRKRYWRRCNAGWPRLEAVFERGLAYARSAEFYETTLVWQWLRVPGDVLFGLRHY